MSNKKGICPRIDSVFLLSIYILLCSLAFYSIPAIADNAKLQQQLEFNLPQGTLTNSLNSLARQAGLTLSIDPTIIPNTNAPEIIGKYSTQDVLQRLLSGTGLQYRVLDGKTITLVATESQSVLMAPINIEGERVVRSKRETASSVNVTTAADLEVLPGPDTLDTIFEQTPNVTLTGQGNEGPTFRGLSTSGVLTSLESFFGGSQPRTTIQVDGRQLTFNEFVYARESIWDLEAVEVFRGPQTTTQGRNSIAGAVNIRTADPNHDEFEAEVRGIGGEFSTRQTSGLVSGPIGDGQLAYRLSGDYREFDAFVDPLGVTESTGADLNEDKTVNLRGKLGWKPDNITGLDALLTYTYTDTSRPQTDSVDIPFRDGDRFNPAFSVFETQSDSAILTVNYEITDHFSVSNTVTYSELDAERLAPVGTGNADIESDDTTNEFILRYNNEQNGFSALVGAYFSSFESDEILDLSGFGIGVGDFTDSRHSTGYFTEATWSVTSQLHLTAGGRWQEDSQNRDGGFAGVIPVDFDDTFNEFLPKFEIAYDVNNDLRVGAFVEKGFNAGGFTFNFDTFETELFDEETLWNYELFARSSFLDGRLTVDGNVFYTDYEDLQIATLVEVGPGFFANVFSNVPDAKSVGAEVEMRYQHNRDLYFQFGAGYTSTEYESDSTAGAAIDGNDFQRAPKLTLSAGVVWHPIQNLELSTFARYTDDYYSDDANLDDNEVDSYEIVIFKPGIII